MVSAAFLLSCAFVLGLVILVAWHHLEKLSAAAKRARGARVPRPDSRGLPRLKEDERRAFLQLWRSVRGRFSTDPGKAVVYADLLASDVIEARGYPLHERQNRDRYRLAHTIAVRTRERDHTRPEELERAIRVFGSLIEDLLCLPERAVWPPLGPGSRSMVENSHLQN